MAEAAARARSTGTALPAWRYREWAGTTFDSPRKSSLARVGREDKPIRKTLQSREFAYRQRARSTEVIHSIRLRAEGPSPDAWMEPPVCVEMAAGQLAGSVVLAPTLTREISMKKRFRQVPMVPALWDASQSHRCVRIYSRHLDVREHGTGALPHKVLIPHSSAAAVRRS